MRSFGRVTAQLGEHCANQTLINSNRGEQTTQNRNNTPQTRQHATRRSTRGPRTKHDNSKNGARVLANLLQQNIATHAQTEVAIAHLLQCAKGHELLYTPLFFVTCFKYNMTTKVQPSPLFTLFPNNDHHPYPFLRCRGLVVLVTTGPCTPGLRRG